ncbi:hypothetical protein ACLOJK_002969 [Asimina triloba]
MDSLKHIFLTEIHVGVTGLHRECMKHGSRKHVVEMRTWFGDLSFNVLVMILGGKRYFGTSDISNEREARQFQVTFNFQRLMERAIYLTGLFYLSDALPFLSWMDWRKKREMKKVVNELDILMTSWLVGHRKTRQPGEMIGGDPDFVDVMLSIVEQDSLSAGARPSGTGPTNAFAIIFAGTDTSTVTQSWAFSQLLNNRTILKKAQDELDAHVGRNRLVEDSDIKNLVYLQAIIKETMRLYPQILVALAFK